MQNHRLTRTTRRTSTVPARRTRRTGHIHHLAAGAVIAAGGMLLGLGQTAAAAAPAIQQDDDIVFQIAEQTCPKSGKVDVAGDHPSLQVTAPADKLIAGWCVKAGSANQGDGPEHHVVDPPATQVTISHSSGKAISHYTLVLVDRPLTDPDPGDDPDPDHPGDLVHPDPDPVEPDPDPVDPDHPGDLVHPDPDPVDPDPEQPNEPVEPVEPNEPPVEIAVLPGTPDEVPTATIPAPTTGGDAPDTSDAPVAPDVEVPEVVEMLPSTGVNSGLLALLAGLFVAAGGALTRTGRRLDA